MVYILFIPPKALCKKNPRSRRRDLYFVVLVIRKGFEPLTYILFFFDFYTSHYLGFTVWFYCAVSYRLTQN